MGGSNMHMGEVGLQGFLTEISLWHTFNTVKGFVFNPNHDVYPKPSQVVLLAKRNRVVLVPKSNQTMPISMALSLFTLRNFRQTGFLTESFMGFLLESPEG